MFGYPIETSVKEWTWYGAPEDLRVTRISIRHCWWTAPSSYPTSGFTCLCDKWFLNWWLCPVSSDCISLHLCLSVFKGIKSTLESMKVQTQSGGRVKFPGKKNICSNPPFSVMAFSKYVSCSFFRGLQGSCAPDAQSVIYTLSIFWSPTQLHAHLYSQWSYPSPMSWSAFGENSINIHIFKNYHKVSVIIHILWVEK